MIVDLYLFCMGLGFFGLLSMLTLGFGHGGHGGHAQTHGGAGHLHGGPTHGAHGVAAHHDAGSHQAQAHNAPTQQGHSGHSGLGKQALLMLLAPRVWFSLIFGFGAVGTLLHPWLAGLPLGAAALAGAWFFERGLVRPVWNFVLRFASTPARTLESAMLEEAVALTNFDAQGQGLISVTLDGQLHQMLGTLQKSSTDTGRRVHTGDKLIIVGVDPRRNSCTVARSGSLPQQIS